MRILLADDHALFREGLSLQIQRLSPDMEVLEAATADEALGLVSDEGSLGLVLLDLAMPGPPWRDVLRQMRQRRPALPVVVLSASRERRDIQDALGLGAAGYIPKTSSGKVMLKALQLVLDGGVYLPPEMLQEERNEDRGTARSARPDSLTPRQYEVLRLLAEGMPNKQIAHTLDLSEGTVKLHVTAILKSLQAGNRTQAVIAATELGLL